MINVVYFLNKSKKPVFFDERTQESHYPLYFRFWYNGNSFARQSSISDPKWGFSSSEFLKLENDGVLEKLKQYIQRIVAKYIDDSAHKCIFDMSHCPWYGRSEKREMNDINAYIDFYGSTVFSIAQQAVEMEFAEKIKKYIDKNIPPEFKVCKYRFADIFELLHKGCFSVFPDSGRLIDLFEGKEEKARLHLIEIERVIADPDKLRLLKVRS